MVFDWKDKNGWMADYVAGNLSEYPVGLQVHLDLKEEDLWIHELRLKIPYSNIHQISNQTGPTIRNWGRTVTGFVVGGILGGFFGGMEEKQYMVLAYTTTENNEIMLAFDVKSLAKVQRELFPFMSESFRK